MPRMAECQDIYPYTEQEMTSIGTSFSQARMHTYLTASGHNREHAIAVYLWNARLSKAIRFPLEIVEVTIRNRANAALIDRWGDQWPTAPAFRQVAAPKTIAKIDKAYADIAPSTNLDRIVAALSFGFWPVLFKGRYVESLWRGRLDSAFPHLPRTLTFEEKLDLLGTMLDEALALRNRVGHLEPIFKTDLLRRHANLFRVVGFACKSTSAWMKHHSTLNSVHRGGPSGVLVESIFMRKAHKTFPRIALQASLAHAMVAMQVASSNFAVVEDGANRLVVNAEMIGKWVMTKAADGIADFTETPLSEVLAAYPKAPLVSRRATLSDLSVDLH